MRARTTDMDYLEQPLKIFLGDLASRNPTPGGGSTAALGGAMGASVGAMAAAYTLGNEKFIAIEPQMLEIHGRLLELKAKLSGLIAADIHAYQKYADARKLPRTTPDEKQSRKEALSVALQLCVFVPQEILDASVTGIDTVEKLAALVNPALAGDVGVSAFFFEASARGAAVQIMSNCASADNDEMRMRSEVAARAVSECERARARIDELVQKMISKQ